MGFLKDVKTVFYTKYFLSYDIRARCHEDQVNPIHLYYQPFPSRVLFMTWVVEEIWTVVIGCNLRTAGSSII